MGSTFYEGLQILTLPYPSPNPQLRPLYTFSHSTTNAALF